MTAAFRIPSVADLSRSLRDSISLVDEAKQRLGDAIDLYDNDSALGHRLALAAYEQDRPAYWTTATYHSAKASILQKSANQMPLLSALRYAYKPGGDYIAALDTLVPLNQQAAVALTVQYAEYGVWRDVEEVLMRRVRRMRP